MTTISNSVTISATTTTAELNQRILENLQQDLKTQGVQDVEGKDLSAFQIIKMEDNQDGTLTVTYQLSLEKPPQLPDGSTERAASAINDLGDNAFVDIGQIMALFHEVAKEQRNAAQEGRQAQLTVQVAELESAAQNIRDAAVAAFVGAMIMGSLTIVGGAMSVFGSVKGGIDAKAGLAKSQEATQLSKDLQTPGSLGNRANIRTEISSLNQQSSSYNQISQTTVGKFQGWSSLLSGAGSIGKGIGDFVSTGDQADSKLDEAAATKAGAQRDELIDYQSRMQQLMTDVRQLMQQISQNQLETARAILRV